MIRSLMTSFRLQLATLTGLILLPPGMTHTAQATEAAVEEARFDVLEFRVLGNTVLEPVEIERAVYPFLGPGQSLARVEEARQVLEQRYRDRGFGTVYVDIPEQIVDSGIVRLQVTEGKLRRVTVENARYFSGRQIRERLPAASEGAAPELPRLQEQLTALNQSTPDRQVTPVLAAGPVPGTVDLKLQVDDALPLHGGVEINDRYTSDTARLRASIAVSYDNLFNSLDSIGLQYQTAPRARDQLAVLALSYTTRLGDDRNRFSLLYIDSDSNVAAFGTLAVLGQGRIWSGRWQRTLSSTARATHSLSAGLDYKDFRETIRLDEDEDFATPISYLNTSLGYTGVWRSPATLWQLAATANFGPRVLGNRDQEFADKRFRGRPNYFYLRADAGLRWQLPGRVSLRLMLGGQYAVEPLISNEQYAIGGADGVRGFLEAEELADTGLRGSLELGAPPLRLFGTATVIEGFLFGDAGRVTSLAPLPGEDYSANLRSWGAGLSLTLPAGVSGQLSWARPLVSASHTQAGDDRLHFSLQTRW